MHICQEISEQKHIIFIQSRGMFADELKKARKAKGYTLKELGEIIAADHSSISKLERGITMPMRKTKIALAQALGTNFGEPELDEYLSVVKEAPPSKREFAKTMTVQEFVSLKFGGSGETRTRAQMRALAQLLDAEIEKETRIMNYPEHEPRSKK